MSHITFTGTATSVIVRHTCVPTTPSAVDSLYPRGESPLVSTGEVKRPVTPSMVLTRTHSHKI
ncbi:hypothetical protein E2C01_091741 [Portunus trituberculatus]|uniref:Uncharacterized protein n=1 Tax=Portunus trituberculatus TaxID=210409 RepID=A0A5B7JNR8_PORTR|nr:hypothetical protein [Portunus trituberculatus]